MAHINCPNCGRKKVSHHTIACPSCGFGIRKYSEEQKRRKVKERLERLEREKKVSHIKMPTKPENKMNDSERFFLLLES